MSPWRLDAPPRSLKFPSDFNDLGGASGGGAVFVQKWKLEIPIKLREFHEIPRFRGISVNPMTSREAKSGKRGAPGGAPFLLGTVPINWTAN